MRSTVFAAEDELLEMHLSEALCLDCYPSKCITFECGMGINTILTCMKMWHQ